MPLYERKKVESRLDFDFSKLYHRPIEEQIEEYLSVPFSLIHDQIPRWNITAYLEGSPSEIQFLPYVIDDFGIVRTATSHKCEKNSREIASSSHFHRGPGDKPNDQNKLVKIETPENKEFQDSHEEVWLGEGMPIGLNKRTLQSYQNRLRRSSIGEKLPITVVCNDSEMSEEAAAVKSIYQSVQTIPTDVYIEQEVTTDELQHLLQERRGFFHYIGSLDDEGFHCANGIFDASEIEEVSIDTFFLNACTSYQQGLELIESGATGGIVSLTNVLNSRAVTMAKNIALLLNRGFSFSATLDIAQSQQLGSEYLTIGCNAQFGLPSSAPTLLEIDQEESNYDVNFHTYPTSQLGLGSIIQLYLPGLNDHHLVSNIIRDINLRGSEINELLDMSNYPVLFEGNLQFANEISLNEGSDDKPAIEEDALNPQSIETELVNVHSYPESYKESLCRRCAAVFESAHFEDISQEDLVTITQVAHLSEAIKRKYLADTSEQLQQSFLEKYTDHPLTSMVPAQEDSENLRPMEARRILRTRRDYLEEISQRAFGETDDEIIEELQWVYLRLIWERIDFTPHADSEVEILSNQTPTALETYTL